MTYWLFLFIASSFSVSIGFFVDAAGVNWQVIDFLSLFFGSLGFFGIVKEAQSVRPWYIVDSARRTAVMHLYTLSSVAPMSKELIEKRIRSVESGRASFDIQEYQIVLPWFSEISKIKVPSENEVLVNYSDVIEQFPQGIEDPEIQSMRDQICRILNGYDSAFLEYKDVVDVPEPSELDKDYIKLAPYFVSLAIALSLFKIVSGA
ncbi:MAG: hypothetical protein H6861_06730 [Rhodospirillales bacterium]|nr:hypothetical protein [Rhodospirillales bacterium]